MLKFLPVLFLTGCLTSTAMVDKRPEIPRSECDVKVYPSYEEAAAEGPVVSMCFVSKQQTAFSPQIADAIDSGKVEICKCGTTLAYVKDMKPATFWENASVVLVGFRRQK